MFRHSFLAAAASLALLAPPALAQTADAAAQRQAVFQQLLSDPSNRQLMRDYARLSVQMRDFEAAAATLERLLDLEPTNVAARVELAIAYFSLGSYAVAEYHLAAAAASGTLSPAQAAQVARYRQEAQERGDSSAYSGRLEVGYAYSSEAGESGPFVNAAIDWRIDLGDANATQWVTEAAYAGYAPDGEFTFNERQTFRLRTGPEFRLQSDAYGPRLQPYVELNWFDGAEFSGRDARAWEFGVAYQNPLNARVTVYGDFSAGHTEFLGDFLFVRGFDFQEVELGATYRPSRDTRLRATALWRAEETEEFFGPPVETTITGLRLSGQHAFEQDFLDVPNRWIVGAFADRRLTAQDGLDVTDDTYGAWLRAFVYEDVYLELSAARLMSESDFGFGFVTERQETIMTVQLGWEF